jgi:hypothetical protein
MLSGRSPAAIYVQQNSENASAQAVLKFWALYYSLDKNKKIEKYTGRMITLATVSGCTCSMLVCHLMQPALRALFSI